MNDMSRLHPATARPNSASDTLQASLEGLSMLRLGFGHRLCADISLDPFKGGLWHGVFGACLHDLAPQAFDHLMAPGAQHRPWALRPPLQIDTWIPAGALLQGELILFGDSARHADACLAALDEMGRRGLGSQRVPAALESAWAVIAGGAAVPLATGSRQTVSAWDVFAHAQIDAPDVLGHVEGSELGLEVRLLSPLRVKTGNELLRDLPTLKFLVQRSIARLVVNLPRGDAGLFAPGEHAALMRAADASPLLAHLVDGVQWQRRSSRQHRVMPFEGLMGTLLYGGAATAAYPWMALAEWWQLGTKTTFGLGVIRPLLRPLG